MQVRRLDLDVDGLTPRSISSRRRVSYLLSTAKVEVVDVETGKGEDAVEKAWRIGQAGAPTTIIFPDQMVPWILRSLRAGHGPRANAGSMVWARYAHGTTLPSLPRCQSDKPSLKPAIKPDVNKPAVKKVRIIDEDRKARAAIIMQMMAQDEDTMDYIQTQLGYSLN